VLATSPTISTPSLNSASLSTTALTETYISNGSTINLLQMLTTVSGVSRAADAATSTVSGIAGIAAATVTAGNPVEVEVSGKASCLFDGSPVAAGDYVQISATAAGNCHDSGVIRATSGETIGFSLTSGSGNTVQTVRLFETESVPGVSIIGGNSGQDNVNIGAGCYLGLFSANCNANETDVVLPMPRSGTITDFNYRSVSGGNSGVRITLRVGGTNTTITCLTVAGSCSDPTDTAPVTAGQTITIFVNGVINRQGSWIADVQ
jgi:hypothetical protein